MDRSNTCLPASLVAVASLFILVGAFSVIRMVGTLGSGSMVFEIGILFIPAGFGLLELSNPWRVLSIILLSLTVMLFPFMMLITMGDGQMMPVSVFGFRFQAGSSIILMVLFVLGMNVWGIMILTGANVRKLFVPEADS